jgi:lysophospholipase L1-like esterase
MTGQPHSPGASDPKWRKVLARICVALIAIGIAFGLCEVAARMIFPRPPMGTRQPQVAYLRDPELRYVLAPNQKGWIDDGLITVNSQGIRGPEVASPKPQGRFRIVIIGDSLTLGWGVDDDQTFSARLDRLLRDRHPDGDLDVLNLGVSGYSTRQEVELLTRSVSRLEPNLVLVGFYSNDVPDALDDDESSATSGTRIAARNPRAGQVMHINPTPSGWWDRQLRKSRAIYVAGRAFNRLRGAGDWGRSRFTMELDLLAGKKSPQLERAWDRVGTQLERLRSLAVAKQFSVGIVVLPCREQVMGQYSNSYQNRVRAMAAPRGFHVIDPLPLMSHNRTMAQALFIPYDRNHPSAAGHAFIAQAIFRYLDEHRIVTPTPKLSRATAVVPTLGH